MKIVVIGGTGLIGNKLIALLNGKGHQVVASPRSGVNAVTGEGLAAALAGAEIVVDVANSPSFEDQAALAFFQASSRNLLAAEAAGGVKHHVALSVVGTARLPDNGYFRAKLAQEALIKAGPIPYTIVQATQFFEFVGSIAQAGGEGQTVRLSPALMQPISANDVALLLADAVLSEAANATIEIAGPQRIGLAALVRQWFAANHDARQVIEDTQAGYFGSVLDDRSLTPGDHPRVGAERFEDWFARTRS
jgi:uncharacterized protein YbjT (DUF2867 family)